METVASLLAVSAGRVVGALMVSRVISYPSIARRVCIRFNVSKNLVKFPICPSVKICSRCF